MTTETTSIDDLLTNSAPPSTTTPKPVVEEDLYGNQDNTEDEPIEASERAEPDTELSASDEESEVNADEYGNPLPKPRTYTEDEHKELVNKAVRERLARLERNQPHTQPQPQQPQPKPEFEYNPDNPETWQMQLESFVKQTVNKMTHEQTQNQIQQRERQIQAEFETKFHQGMGKFNDFVDVVGAQPISDAMTMATRAMTDPAAFLYAASKRHPQELTRISNINDPYTQMVEMGKLEERMRKTANATSAPRPISRVKDDSPMPERRKEKRDDTIEDLIAKSESKRLSLMKQRRAQ